jgi:hypothetical protein
MAKEIAMRSLRNWLKEEILDRVFPTAQSDTAVSRLQDPIAKPGTTVIPVPQALTGPVSTGTPLPPLVEIFRAEAPEGGTLEMPANVGTASDADLTGLEQGYRYYFDITLDAAKGQTFDTLEQAFSVAGFDHHRPRMSLGDAHVGSSYWKRENGTAHVYIYPAEAQSLRQQGYGVAYDAETPRPRIISSSISFGSSPG